MSIETIREDVSQGLSEADAANAFLSNWMKTAPKNSEPVDTDDEEEEDHVVDETDDEETLEDDESEAPDDDGSEESEEDPEEDDDEAPKPKVKKGEKYADDDHTVKVTVDGQELQVSVKDLKRLYGQEASLTQKSQAVATERKKYEDALVKQDYILSDLVTKAATKFKPYAEIDWMIAQQRMQPEDFAQLRKDAKAAYDDLQYLDTQIKGVKVETKAHNDAAVKEAAQKCIAAISDSTNPSYIEGWSDKKYDEIRTFGIKSGISEDAMSKLTDPVSFSILHKAMLYEKGKQVATKKKAKVSPKKVLTSQKSEPQVFGAAKIKKAAAQLRKTGSTEDAANAFYTRWTSGKND